MKSTFTFLFLLGFGLLAAQQKTITVTNSAGESVPFATISYGENQGTITNEDGQFTIANAADDAVLEISALGYSSQTIAIKDLENTVVLENKYIDLDEVVVFNKDLDVEEIVENIKDNLAVNYGVSPSRKKIFYRKTYDSEISKAEIEVEDSSIEELNQKLFDSICREIKQKFSSYSEVVADVYGDQKKQELDIIKAANLFDPRSTESVEELFERVQAIAEKNVKKDSYFKVRSGLIGTKLDQEEMDLAEEVEKEKTPAEKLKEEQSSKERLHTGVQAYINNLLTQSIYSEDAKLDVLEKDRKYEFEITGHTVIDDELVYVIDFRPDRSADYKGTMYVNAQDFGVFRVDFTNVQPIKKFKLFGVSHYEDVYRGKMIYTKNTDGKYDFSYLELTHGATSGIDRPLTIIEKNKNVKGRRKQNELDMEIDFKFKQSEKTQVVVLSNEGDLKITNTAKTDGFEYQTFKKYNPDFWQGYSIIEPNAALKAFEIESQD